MLNGSRWRDGIPLAPASHGREEVGRHVLVARADNAGDVLLAGPAVRAVAARVSRVTLLCGPRAAAAGALLPGVDQVVCERLPWIDPEPAPVTRRWALGLADRMAAVAADEAIISTSFHQSPLPLALALRMAGVTRIAAISPDYPGALLDVRVAADDDLHEVERNLALAAAAGYPLPGGDDGRLAVSLPPAAAPPFPLPEGGYVVVHPGASVPARAWSPEQLAALTGQLARAGRSVVVTGGAGERALTAAVAGGAHGGGARPARRPAGRRPVPRSSETTGTGTPQVIDAEAAQVIDARAAQVTGAGAAWVIDAGGRTDLVGLAAVLRGADAVVVGNTGPAHLAAAVGTPVVCLFAPTVPARRWHPWMVPYRLLGDQGVPCRGCRARRCPVPGHPCLASVEVASVAAAVEEVAASGAGRPAPPGKLAGSGQPAAARQYAGWGPLAESGAQR